MRILIALLFFLCTSHAFADSCSGDGLSSDYKVWKSTNTQLIAAVAKVSAISGVRVDAVCEWHGPEEPIPFLGYDSIERALVLMMPSIFPPKLSEKALLGLVAHEIGHSRFEEVSYAYISERVEFEMKVDAVAAAWVGKDALRASLSEVIDILIEYARDFQRQKKLSREDANIFVETVLWERYVRLEALGK